jgi:hypothetical protein
MRFQSKFRKISLLACTALILVSFAVSYGYAHKAHPQDGYKFQMHNASRNYILALVVSEKGKKWSKFDIGEGLAPGKNVTLVWDESTEGSGCEWWIKALYDDGNLSAPAKIDFCAKDLVIDF